MITKQGDKEPNDKMYHTRARVHTKHTANRRTDKRTHEKQMANLMTTNFLQAFLLRICVFEANHNSSSRHKQEQQIQTKPNQTN